MRESPLNVPKAAWRQDEELDIFADAVGSFFEKECAPHVAAWRKAGIVPRDALAWWRIFPYATIRANTDAMLPMCYTSRYLTLAETTAMTAACVTTIREQTGDPAAPVHVIAGVTDFLKPRLLVAAARGAKSAGAMGFSLDNLETPTLGGWRAIDVGRAPTS